MHFSSLFKEQITDSIQPIKCSPTNSIYPLDKVIRSLNSWDQYNKFEVEFYNCISFYVDKRQTSNFDLELHVNYILELGLCVPAYGKTWTGVEWTGFVKHGLD